METERVSIRAVSGDEEGSKRVDKVEVTVGVQLKPDTIRYIEKKLHDKGIQRMERHPVDGLPLVHGPPKSGHGGKFTWEGPSPEVEAELDPVPPAINPKDPNYEEEEEEEGPDGLLIGQVEVAKAAEAREGISRIEIRLTPLQS
ncbi:uncharacterized protein LOC120270747 [Dioscorea cayenensis subsp. rotundata]|uniref:Uncharacterized protein LOC120270747 n=1 Tax=Dioscorea cayennensis subsp. rotundata TaxID=55577 RepID=A0AB40C4G1_DIOCR|nr:uncharacterized protein LOC120270747 [Dioscorea cayenensis subsp. rotundata]